MDKQISPPEELPIKYRKIGTSIEYNKEDLKLIQRTILDKISLIDNEINRTNHLLERGRLIYGSIGRWAYPLTFSTECILGKEYRIHPIIINGQAYYSFERDYPYFYYMYTTKGNRDIIPLWHAKRFLIEEKNIIM
jgi:hypothetical protein